jgi:hypothetical protein
VSAHELFQIADILPSFFGGRRGFVVLMSSYFDESASGQYFAVGGYIFRKSKIRHFEREWALMLKSNDLPYFRMSACNARQYPFANMTDAECDCIAREAIRIVCKYAVYGHFVAVRPSEFEEILGKGSFADNPYTLCIWLCLMAMRRWSDNHDSKALIGYFFEAGCNYQNDAEKLVGALGLPDRDFDYRYAAHAFVQKDMSMPTQAADILVWQATKNLNRYDSGNKQPRGDFRALLDGVETGYNNVDVRMLKEFDRIVRKAAGPNGTELAKHALRNDMKNFMKDREAVLKLLEHQQRD